MKDVAYTHLENPDCNVRNDQRHKAKHHFNKVLMRNALSYSLGLDCRCGSMTGQFWLIWSPKSKPEIASIYPNSRPERALKLGTNLTRRLQGLVSYGFGAQRPYATILCDFLFALLSLRVVFSVKDRVWEPKPGLLWDRQRPSPPGLSTPGAGHGREALHMFVIGLGINNALQRE